MPLLPRVIKWLMLDILTELFIITLFPLEGHGIFSHLNSSDSERSSSEIEIEGTTTFRNEKKSKFFRSFPTDTHGPNDFGDKEHKRKTRKYTIHEEQKLT